MTQYTFQGLKLLIVMFDVNKASTKNIEAVQLLTKQLEGKVDCFILTSSGSDAMEAFRHEHQLAVPYYYADATVLKTIIRSNPVLHFGKTEPYWAIGIITTRLLPTRY